MRLDPRAHRRVGTLTTGTPLPPPRWSVVAGEEIADLDDDGTARHRSRWHPSDATAPERRDTRWVWADTARTYPEILSTGARVARAWDLRSHRRILRATPGSGALGLPEREDLWDDAAPERQPDDLFAGAFDAQPTLDEAVAELARQRDALDRAPDPARLRLLLFAESAGALIAAEMHAAGLPWDRAVHEDVLRAALGPRPPAGAVPERMRELAAQVREALGDPEAALDSPVRLLRSLHRAGLPVATTSKWELGRHEHPVVAPLLEYKRLARLWTANGWAWLDEWVRDGRFRPVYLPGAVVTGRWASSGGGALQIPKRLRPAVLPDPGWVVVDADVAQLEPRVLAAMSRDERLAVAARGRDLYEGIVATGVVATRDEAKYAVLGAMYGATSGDGGRLVPRLRSAFPRAMALVDGAAQTGEDGGRVSTWLGRGSPGPGEAWRAQQRASSEADAERSALERARRSARDRGRFTRNFVVQGTAAEWALCWLGEIRHGLEALPDADPASAADLSGPAFSRRAHLVFFLHDEVMVHAPASQAAEVERIIADAARVAGQRLFGTFPIDFPLELQVLRRGSAGPGD